MEKRVAITTGFRNIDISIGYRIYDENTGDLVQTNRGYLSGAEITLIGASHTGKSTLGIQIFGNGLREWVMKGDTRSKLHIFDTEGGLNYERIRMLCNFTQKQVSDHVVMEHDISISGWRDRLEEIIKEKADKKYETVKLTSHQGGEIDYYPPTFIIIDSITDMQSKKTIEEIKKETTQTVTMQTYGEITRLLQQFRPSFRKYNINTIYVAHTGKKILMDAMPGAKPKREWKSLPNDLDIKAPNTIIYGIDLGIYIDKIIARDKKHIEKQFTASTYLNASAIMGAVIYKSRQPGEGTEICLTQTEKGFNPLASFLYDCQDNGILVSGPGSKTLEGYGKVMNNKIFETFATKREFREALFDAYDKLRERGLESNKLLAADVQATNDLLSLLLE